MTGSGGVGAVSGTGVCALAQRALTHRLKHAGKLAPMPAARGRRRTAATERIARECSDGGGEEIHERFAFSRRRHRPYTPHREARGGVLAGGHVNAGDKDALGAQLIRQRLCGYPRVSVRWDDESARCWNGWPMESGVLFRSLLLRDVGRLVPESQSGTEKRQGPENKIAEAFVAPHAGSFCLQAPQFGAKNSTNHTPVVWPLAACVSCSKFAAVKAESGRVEEGRGVRQGA